ncbi:hypothetical protein Mgra_00000361 [Meloidogyne graminicola]|uniref:Uncharacterized protein n=1 Tax=Meloidogyne graminicola TaxID=189291 RepID=A0A8T0A4R6_9BILA|nr:hypothetical protein Mgra_00000361 [Meloidogyne graminicola]
MDQKVKKISKTGELYEKQNLIIFTTHIYFFLNCRHHLKATIEKKKRIFPFFSVQMANEACGAFTFLSFLFSSSATHCFF